MLGRHYITRVQPPNQKLTGSETPHRHDLSQATTLQSRRGQEQMALTRKGKSV